MAFTLRTELHTKKHDVFSMFWHFRVWFVLTNAPHTRNWKWHLLNCIKVLVNPLKQEKILCTSHNALLLLGYCVQVVLWIINDETHLDCEKSSQSCILAVLLLLTTCTKHLIGSNALWEVHGIFCAVYQGVHKIVHLATLSDRYWSLRHQT